MSNPLREYDVKRIVKGADVEKGINLWHLCLWVIGMGLFIWLLLAYIPGCIQRDNEQFAAEQARWKEKPHTPESRADAINTIIEYR